MNNNSPFDVTDTDIVYENPWIKLREDKILRKNGNRGIYSYLEVGKSVAIVAVNDEDEICIIESYRHPFKKWFWELPGGGSEDENILACSKRELIEETGITAQDWKILGEARVCNGLSTEWRVNVLAKKITYSNYTQSEDETRARKFVSLSKLDEMIQKGEFVDNQSITALYMYKLWLEKQKSLPASK